MTTEVGLPEFVQMFINEKEEDVNANHLIYCESTLRSLWFNKQWPHSPEKQVLGPQRVVYSMVIHIDANDLQPTHLRLILQNLCRALDYYGLTPLNITRIRVRRWVENGPCVKMDVHITQFVEGINTPVYYVCLT
jgi:hypothetical protein